MARHVAAPVLPLTHRRRGKDDTNASSITTEGAVAVQSHAVARGRDAVREHRAPRPDNKKAAYQRMGRVVLGARS
ncbi:MAG: hypothetical protein LC808_40285 [Actinobacteria bacterium]|nr:hypothetical protein [Actinomycetota bacterium]